jgi:hypothetical protein
VFLVVEGAEMGAELPRFAMAPLRSGAFIEQAAEALNAASQLFFTL